MLLLLGLLCIALISFCFYDVVEWCWVDMVAYHCGNSGDLKLCSRAFGLVRRLLRVGDLFWCVMGHTYNMNSTW